jgi:hypothetical protein
MTASSFADVLIGLAVVVYLCSRQLTWRPVDLSRMWRMPLILGAIGLVSIFQGSTGHAGSVKLNAADVVILAISAVLALASGVAMGRIAQFRRAVNSATESRTGWLGAALWIGLIALRVLLDVAGRHLGAEFATSSGMIFLVIALNRAARTLVFAARLDRHHALAA